MSRFFAGSDSDSDSSSEEEIIQRPAVPAFTVSPMSIFSTNILLNSLIFFSSVMTKKKLKGSLDPLKKNAMKNLQTLLNKYVIIKKLRICLVC